MHGFRPGNDRDAMGGDKAVNAECQGQDTGLSTIDDRGVVAGMGAARTADQRMYLAVFARPAGLVRGQEAGAAHSLRMNQKV